jgi:IS30 family transposase
MGRNYSQLDLDERIELNCLRDAGCSRREIGRLMGRSHTTICRELERNSLPKSGYKPARADIMAGVRRDRPCKLQRLSTLRNDVHDGLAMGWSPDQIAGRLQLEGSKHTISHETIYRYIYRKDVRGERLYRYLPHAKTKRGLRYFKRRREPLPQCMNIANRPQAIEDRLQFGHWEGDLIQFRSQRGAVLNVTERSTRFSLLSSLPNKRSADTGQAIVDAMSGLPDQARKSITFDRGGEFRDHPTMKDKLGVDIWYCDPHSPWQRGMIENTNGILRRDMPRKSDISDYTDKDIETIQHLLNSTPRKCLGYRTPEEAFIQKIIETSGALDM